MLAGKGRVHPYAKPLSLREGDFQQVDRAVASFGRTPGELPLRVETVLACGYRPDVEWRRSRRSVGRGVLAMLANTVPARSRPAEALHAVTRALNGAAILEGERGEASTVVEDQPARYPAASRR